MDFLLSEPFPYLDLSFQHFVDICCSDDIIFFMISRWNIFQYIARIKVVFVVLHLRALFNWNGLVSRKSESGVFTIAWLLISIGDMHLPQKLQLWTRNHFSKNCSLATTLLYYLKSVSLPFWSGVFAFPCPWTILVGKRYSFLYVSDSAACWNIFCCAVV